MLHLKTLNEHIITIQSMRAPGLVRLLADRIAKAPATRAGVSGGGGVGAVSISAFAFQGTNAHAIVAGSGSSGR